MPRTPTDRTRAGQYVCVRCEDSFNSIMELRQHEKLCSNGRMVVPRHENGTGSPLTRGSVPPQNGKHLHRPDRAAQN